MLQDYGLLGRTVLFYSHAIFVVCIDPGVYSASNRKEYQKHKKIMFLGSNATARA
jgi:hypothetical protein